MDTKQRVHLSAKDVAAMRERVATEVAAWGNAGVRWPGVLRPEAELALLEHVEELRAVLAPLMESALHHSVEACPFCGVIPGHPHDDGCAVHRADELMGRR